MEPRVCRDLAGNLQRSMKSERAQELFAHDPAVAVIPLPR
jgi:hypothetical protein